MYHIIVSDILSDKYKADKNSKSKNESNKKSDDVLLYNQVNNYSIQSKQPLYLDINNNIFSNFYLDYY